MIAHWTMLLWPPNLKPRVLLFPQRITDEEREVYQRTANADSAEAAAITRVDHNSVFHRPEPEEEDHLYASKLGFIMPGIKSESNQEPKYSDQSLNFNIKSLYEAQIVINLLIIYRTRFE